MHRFSDDDDTKSEDMRLPWSKPSEPHHRFRTIVEVVRRNGTIKRKAIDARFLVNFRPGPRASKRIQRIIVDPNIKDDQNIRRFKWPGDDHVQEIAEAVKTDPTEIPRFVMTEVLDPKVSRLIKQATEQQMKKAKKPKKLRQGAIKKYDRSIRRRKEGR